MKKHGIEMDEKYYGLKVAECLVEPCFPDDPMKEGINIVERLIRAGMKLPEEEDND